MLGKFYDAAIFLAMSFSVLPAQQLDSVSAEPAQDDSTVVEADNAGKDTVYVLRGSEDEKSELLRDIEAIKDTVLVLTRNGTRDLLSDMRQTRRNARERGYGGALGPSPCIYGLQMNPISDLVGSYSDLSSIGFDIKDGFDLFVMMGGIGYGALGNGLRVGGGGYGGSREYGRTKTDVLNDSAQTINYMAEIGVGFGGVVIEKAFVKNDANLFLGTMIGGGGMSFNLRSTTGSPFNQVNPDIVQLPSGEASASFFLLELHGGMTYSFLSWLHIGADLSAPFFMSTSGFKAANQSGITGGFVTVNPGVRIRLMFGNIG